MNYSVDRAQKITIDSLRLQNYQDLIPPLLWSDNAFFGQNFSELEVHFIELPTDLIVSSLYKLNVGREISELPVRVKICLWLAIAFSHRDLSDLDLLELANVLELKENEIYLSAAALGKISFYDQLCTTYGKQQLINALYRQDIGRIAFDSTDGAVIKYLIDLKPMNLEQILSEQIDV